MHDAEMCIQPKDVPFFCDQFVLALSIVAASAWHGPSQRARNSAAQHGLHCQPAQAMGLTVARASAMPAQAESSEVVKHLRLRVSPRCCAPAQAVGQSTCEVSQRRQLQSAASTSRC